MLISFLNEMTKTSQVLQKVRFPLNSNGAVFNAKSRFEFSSEQKRIIFAPEFLKLTIFLIAKGLNTHPPTHPYSHQTFFV